MPRGRPKGSKDKTPRKNRGKKVVATVTVETKECCGDCGGTCTPPATK